MFPSEKKVHLFLIFAFLLPPLKKKTRTGFDTNFSLDICQLISWQNKTFWGSNLNC